MKKPTTVKEVEDRIDYFRQRAKRKNHGMRFSSIGPGVSMGHFIDEYDSEKFYMDGSYTINPKTLKITVKGDLWLGHFTDAELGLEFETITGQLHINNSPNLITLEGFPNSAGRVTLWECPKLRSLDYISETIDVYIYKCPITDLTSLPKTVNRLSLIDVDITDFSTLIVNELQDLNVVECSKLTSLKGLENLVIKKKLARNNWSGKFSYSCGIYLRKLPDLKSLEYLPDVIDGNLEITSIPIPDLKYVSRIIKGTLELQYLTLTDLDYISVEVGGFSACLGMDKLVDISKLTKTVIHERLDLNSKQFSRKFIKKLMPNYKGIIGRN